MPRKRNRNENRHTIASVTGTVSQIPVNPNNDDKIHAAGMISIKPLKTEMTNASFGLSHEHKNADAIMFTPAKNKLIKKILMPPEAIVVNRGSSALLNASAIGTEKRLIVM